MDVAVVGLSDSMKHAEERAMMHFPIGMGKSERVPDMTTFPITARAIAEVGSMISLVNEARSTNYWSSVQTMSDQKKQKAREKKRWAKIRRKQGR
jgi:hypothetical protein